MNKRENNLDIVRCFANYMIIVMHASSALQYCAGKGAEFVLWTFLCSCLTQFALPALFLISGYLLFYNYSFSTFPQKITRRIKRLFIPYLTWNLTFVAFFLLLKGFFPRLADRVTSFGLDTFSGAFSKILDFTVHPIDGPLWFLRTLFVLSLVSPLFFLMIKSNKTVIRYSGFLIIVILYVVCYTTGITYSLIRTYPLYAITLFYVGGLIATNKMETHSLSFSSAYWLIPCIIGLGFITLFVFSPDSVNIPLFATLNDVGKLLMTPGLFYIVSKCNVNEIVNKSMFKYAKEMSFFAYAGHFLFCSMIMHTAASLLKIPFYGKCTILIFVFCFVGVPVMTFIYWLGKKVLPRFMKLYDGTL